MVVVVVGKREGERQHSITNNVGSRNSCSIGRLACDDSKYWLF